MFSRIAGALGREAEGIPAHRVQDVVALHALQTRQHVGRGVALRVADVQAGTGRIREHVEDVVLRLGGQH
jgi:hypothetical protein